MLNKIGFGLFCFMYLCQMLMTDHAVLGQETAPQTKAKAYGQIARLDDWVTALTWSPDGKLLAIGTYEQTLLWDRESKKVIHKLPAKYGFVRALLFTPDGNQLYTGCYQSLEIFDVSTGKRLKQIKAHGTDITQLAWYQAGKGLISSSKDRQIHFWKIDSSIPEKSFKFDQPVYDFEISHDERILAVATGDETRVTLPGQVELVDMEQGQAVLKEKFPEQLRYASSVLFSSDEKLIISGSNDTKGYVYKSTTAEATGFFGGHKRPINDMVLMPESKFVISVSGGRTKGKNELKVWNHESGDELASFEPHTDIVNCLALSPDQQLLATGGQDKTAIIWYMNSIIKNKSGTSHKAQDKPKTETNPTPPTPALPE